MAADRVPSRTRKRVIIAAGAVLVVTITVLGVLQVWPDDDPAGAAGASQRQEATALGVATRFLDAFAAGEVAAAAALTDDATAATATLGAVRQSLAPESVQAGKTALVDAAGGATEVAEPFTLTWTLGGGHDWTYESTLPLVKHAGDWRVRWRPSIVHPRLAPGQNLGWRAVTGQAAVLDRDGGPLMNWSATGTVPADPALAPLLAGGLAQVVGAPAAGSGYVVLVDDAGTELEVLHGARTTPVTATLSRPVQLAAQAAVAGQQLPTMLVAVQPSTGEILAVAQNSAAGPGLVALTGLFPPGSTFKVATAAAIIESGAADVDTVLPCPASVRVGQRTIRNADFELGDVPLRTAFAMSCNTTFAARAATLPPAALPAAAERLGLAADFVIPGFDTEAGSVPETDNTTQLAENSIGQGTVQVSCFGLALMSSTVASGRAVTPALWREHKTAVTVGYEPPSPGVLGSLRTMMREVVTRGRATTLSGYGAVFGKTGTAQVGDGSTAHGWFTGYRDDIAFATLVLNGSTSDAAVSVTGAFLGGLG